jgi:hypothetical protein
VLSAMSTPVSRVWRFTPADGRPLAHVREAAGRVRLTTRHGSGSVVTVDFEQAALVRIPDPVSAVGVWINQSLQAKLPANWQCRVN